MCYTVTVQYTQLTLGQARALLHDILADRSHGPGCDCAACLYAAYHRSRKAKIRPYSKKLFFMFDLWASFYWDLYFDHEFRRGHHHLKTYKIEWDFKAWGRKPRGSKFGEPVEISSLVPDIEDWGPKDEARLAKNAVRSVRDRTRSMIKDLVRIERTREGKLFLNSYLKKRSFYIYYRRTQDPTFRKLLMKIWAEIPYFTDATWHYFIMSIFATGLYRKRRQMTGKRRRVAAAN